MDTNNPDIEKYNRKNSTRHHYIPQFLIEGFTDSNGLLYVYDKKRNKILKNPKSPKSIFFERDRNTIDLPNNNQSSILEDVLYSKIDNDGSKIVKYYQETDLKLIEFNYDNTAQFLFFLITLFWRIPLTDYAVKDLITHADIDSKKINPETLKNDKDFYKTQRGGIILHTINEMISSGNSGSKFINVHQMSKDILVLGDNPLLFRKTSHKFSEFGEIDFLFALTSRRIYSSTKESLGTLPTLNAFKYNAAIINQSIRYVCSSNLDTLEKSVKVYTEFCKYGINFTMAENVFNTEDIN